MSSPTLKADELLALAMSGTENMISAAEEREQSRPHTFLTLAPTTSASYPVRKPVVQSPVAPPAKVETPVAVTAPLASEQADTEGVIVGLGLTEKTRRSSSLSSNGSLSQKRRFLKLGPVHHGVHHEGECGDWSEEVIV